MLTPMSLLLLSPVYITLFWAIVLGTSNSKRCAPKVFLGKFMAVMFVMYVAHALYYTPKRDVYIYFDAIYVYCTLLSCPIYYIYLRLLTIDNKFDFGKHYKYLLVPTLMFLLYLASISLLTRQEHIYFIYEVSVGGSALYGKFAYLKYLCYLFRFVFVVQALFYLYLSYATIERSRSRICNFYSDVEINKRLPTNVFLIFITTVISIAGGIFIHILGRNYLFLHPSYLYVIVPLFAVQMFLIGWLGNRQLPLPVIISEVEPCCNKIDNNTDLQYLQIKIKKMFDEDKIFLNRRLTLSDVAQRAATNRTYMSRAINQLWQTNFCTFVNQYRLKYAEDLLNENPNCSSEEIAELSGFGSVNSMNRCFLELKQISFKNYKNQIQQKSKGKM